MRKTLSISAIALAMSCASAPPSPEMPTALPLDNARMTEKLMTDSKFHEGLDGAMASGSTLEPFVRQLSAVPPTDESRVLMNALLEEEAKRRPLSAPPLLVPPPPASTLSAFEPTPIADSRTSTSSGFWTEHRLIGALIGVVALGLVISRMDYKLVITTP